MKNQDTEKRSQIKLNKYMDWKFTLSQTFTQINP